MARSQFSILLFICFWNIAINCIGQIKAKKDSVNDNNNADQALQLIKNADSIALADSINALFLTKQLNALTANETAKRIQIEQQLKAIKTKDSLRSAQLYQEVLELKNTASGFPVKIHKDTLFLVYTRIGSITPRERAELVNSRLNHMYERYILEQDSLFIFDNGQTIDVFFRDNIILSITDLDEIWYGENKRSLANNFKTRISKDVAVYKKDKSVLNILKEIGLVLLVIVMQIFLVKGINRLFKGKLALLLQGKKGKWFKGVKIKNHELVEEEKQLKAALFTLNILRYVVIGLLLYLTLPLIFSIFPVTQRFAEVLFGYILRPVNNIGLSLLRYLPELITVIVIVIFTRYLLKFLRFLSTEIQRERLKLPGFFPDWAKPTYNIVKVLILAFMFVVIFPYLPGSDSPIFKGVSVFIGIVFSLGSSSIIGNVMAGLVITYMRPYKIGDRIKIGEVVGNVVEKTAFVTRIRTPKKEFITIPNSNILSSNVINYSNSKLQGGLVVHSTVTIGYDVPWRKVHSTLISAAKKTSNLNAEIAPFVLQTSLDDFYVSYQINAHTNEPDKLPLIYSELHQNIQDNFNEAGIEILSPHYRAARDGNPMAMPEAFLPENYVPKGFILDQSEGKKKE